jgi:hypothetical protein
MMRTRAAMVLAVALAAQACGAVAPAERAETLDLDELVRTEWYGAYVLGRKAGYVVVVGERAKRDGADVFIDRAEARLVMKVADETLTVRLELGLLYEAAPPYRLVGVETEERTAQTTSRLRAVRDGDELAVTRLRHGRITNKRMPAPRHTLVDTQRLEQFVEGNPEPGDTVAYLDFDPDALVDKETTARVEEVVEKEWRGETRRVFVLELDDGESTSTRHLLEDGTVIKDAYGSTIVLKREDEETARTLPDEAAWLDVRRTIAVAGLDTKGDEIGELVLAIAGMPDGVVVDRATQRVARGEDGALIVTLTPGVVPDEPLVTETDRERLGEYLDATDEIQSDHARIRRRAQRIVRGVDDPAAQARRICRWVHRHVEGRDAGNYETALDVLRHLEGDCTEHALLFVALCRAAGIPARQVSGLVYSGPAERAFAMHRWAQVYVGEWVDVDPTLNQFPADATHIELDVEGDRWFELFGAFDTIRIEVVSVEERQGVAESSGGRGVEKSLP